jgi:hypothetical protein
VNRRKGVNRFDLNNYLTANDQVNAKTNLKFHFLVVDRKADLLNNYYSLLL